jgi:hypothetical protein
MTATFIHHEADELSEVRFKDHGHLYRKDDIVVLRQKFYRVEDCQYDLDEDVATYWLEAGSDEHPTAPSL